MNKIYSLKYSAISGGLIPVSEISRGVSTIRKCARVLCVLSLLSYMDGAVAAKLYIDNVWTRDFLDLGQNKGIFKPGAENVSIQLKDGTRFNFPNVGIPDFSAAAKNGAVTSIGGAYGISAKHYRDGNDAIVKSTWGQTDYKMVNRESRHDDFSVHRLSKFVVETKGVRDGVDFSLSSENALARYGVDFNGKKQIIGFRAGNGLTPIIKDNKSNSMGSAFDPEFFSGGIFSLDWKNPTITYSDKTAFKTMQQQGDSGSSAYLYDNKNKKWVVLGTTHYLAGSNESNLHVGYGRYDQKLIDDFKNKYTQKVELSGKTAFLSQNDYQFNGDKFSLQTVGGNGDRKDLFFYGGGKIVLNSNVDQGSGGLIFDSGHKYGISGEHVFKGAGIDVGAGSTVEWNVKYASNDALHKIGEGTLDVRKRQDTNLKTGDGLTTLSVTNAFNNIYFAGGRVKLNADNALGQGDYAGVFFSKYGGTLDLNGHSQRFNKVAASDNDAVITNSNISTESTVSIDSKDKYLFHGVVSGNTRIEHKNKSKSDGEALILDGEVDVNAIDVENANLVLQGHPTDHAIFRDGQVKCIIPNILCDADKAAVIQGLESEANKKNNTAYKSNNQVSDFTQPDWESRRFSVGELSLRDASLSIGRDAIVDGRITAENSTVTIGDNVSYIDLYSGSNIVDSGFTFRQKVISGKSVGQSEFVGGISANNSHVVIGEQATATMTDNITLTNTPLSVKDSGKLIVKGGMYTSGNIDVSGGLLSFSGKPSVSTQDNKVYSPTVNLIEGKINLTGGAAFEAKDQTSVVGDIYSEAGSDLRFGSLDKTTLDKSTPQAFSVGLLNGFSTAYRGSIVAPRAYAEMEDTWWQVTGNSSLNKLKSNYSMIHFTGREKFQTLTVDELISSHSAFVMRTNLEGADKLVVTKRLEGANNTLLVDFLDKKKTGGKLSLELISAPKGTKRDVFDSKSQSIGFSDVTPVIETQEQNDKVAWVLTGYETKVNSESVKKATNLMGMGYKSFLTEVNNLNKRMGDLRDNIGEAGAWARIMDGSGSTKGGYSNKYEHVQVGVDKQTELDGADVFTGITMTYTDNNFSDHGLSGRTASVGWGVYASTLFKSGGYIDLIGKYIHHNNEYVAELAGLGKKNYSSHSLYLGSEVGYRYYIADSLWVEPQAELTYGTVSGRELNWNDRGMELTLKNDDSNPLIGRYGFDVGRQFVGKNWRITAKAGVSHQFDILGGGEVVLRDVSGEQRIKNEKDGRMLMNVGLNAEVGDNLRAGLELEKSVFGKYNVDNQINFNIRYSF